MGASQEENKDTEHWDAVLSEVRRQVKHVADATGVESLVEGKGRFFDDGAEETWQVVPDLHKVGKDAAWQEQQWQNAFEVVLMDTPDSLKGGSHQDDLLFFVLREQTKADASPVFVRRKSKAMPVDLCVGSPQSERVSWVDSLMLNLVLQTAFRLTCSVCGREDLAAANSAADFDLLPGVSRVVGEVYASPSRVQVHGRSGEAMVSAYPDICFAVDETHAGFDELVLPEPGACLHVQLAAYQGMAMQEAPVILLSGFVSYEQLADAMEKHRSRLRRKGEELTINMRGPGGQGRALITAKWLHHEDSGHLLQAEPAPRPGGLLMRLKSTILPPVLRTEQRICCSIMEVTLPVGLLAAMVLGVPLRSTADG